MRPPMRSRWWIAPEPGGSCSPSLSGGSRSEKMAELNQINRDDPAKYLSHADCHMTAQTIMGSTDKPSGIEDREKAVVRNLSTPELDPIPKSATEGKMSDHGANRVLDQFLIQAVPEFSRRLARGLDATVAQLPGGRQVARGGGYAAAVDDIGRRVAG